MLSEYIDVEGDTAAENSQVLAASASAMTRRRAFSKKLSGMYMAYRLALPIDLSREGKQGVESRMVSRSSAWVAICYERKRETTGKFRF